MAILALFVSRDVLICLARETNKSIDVSIPENNSSYISECSPTPGRLVSHAKGERMHRGKFLKKT